MTESVEQARDANKSIFPIAVVNEFLEFLGKIGPKRIRRFIETLKTDESDGKDVSRVFLRKKGYSILSTDVGIDFLLQVNMPFC